MVSTITTSTPTLEPRERSAPSSWFRGRHSPIGLDFGRSGVRAAQLKRMGRGYALWTVAHLRNPDGGGLDGGLVGGEPWSTVLRRTLRQHEFHGRSVVPGLSPPDVELYPLELPQAGDGPQHSGEDAEFDQAAHFELRRLGPATEEDVETDWWFIPHGHRSTTTAVGVVARSAQVRAVCSLCRAAGYECARVDASACAAARFGYALYRPGRDRVWGLLDLGVRSVRMTVCVDGVPVLVRTLDQGGERWTRRIAEGLQVSAETAEFMKRDHGLSLEKSGEGDRGIRGSNLTAQGAVTQSLGRSTAPVPALAAMIHTLLRADLEQMIREIERSYSYVLQCFPNRSAGTLLMLGGGSTMHNLDRFLQGRLGIPVVPVSSLPACEFIEVSRLPWEQAGEYAAAIGLTLQPTPAWPAARGKGA